MGLCRTAPCPPGWPSNSADGPTSSPSGRWSRRKNDCAAVPAFRTLVADPAFADWRLVAVGGLGWMYDEIVAEAKHTPEVILAGRLSHPELAAAYRHASVFAYPFAVRGVRHPGGRGHVVRAAGADQ